jgi:hypothetical protein
VKLRQLGRGMAKLGHNWSAILKAYDFAPGRMAEELREKDGDLLRQSDDKVKLRYNGA